MSLMTFLIRINSYKLQLSSKNKYETKLEQQWSGIY